MRKHKFGALSLITLLAAIGSCSMSSCSKKTTDNSTSPPPAVVPPTTTPVVTPSPVGDVVGKVVVGYQGWFAAIGDGSPINMFWHWSNDWAKPPSPTNKAISAWPDVRDYTTTFKTDFANLNNGSEARVFSSYTDQTVDVQFKWMKDYGIDGAALQRFNPSGLEGPVRDAMAAKVKIAAEKKRRKILHHVRCKRLDKHGYRNGDRLDKQNVGLYGFISLCQTEWQASGMHLGLWF